MCSIKNNTSKIICSLIFTIIAFIGVCFAVGTVQAFADDKTEYVTVQSPDGYTEQYSLPEKQNDFKIRSANQSSVRLSWHNPWGSYPDGYEISIYNADSGTYTPVAYTQNEAYKVTGLKSGAKYTFAVRGYIEIYGVLYYGSYSDLLYAATSPASTTLKSAKYKSQGKAVVKWSRVSSASGYVIQYSTSSKFSESGATCTAYVSGSGKTSKEIGGLAKKKYYFRVCPYKSNGETRVMGKWSKAKSVSVKKGASLKTALNYIKTDLSGRKMIKAWTGNGVDIKKYKTTYDRIQAIYNWHAKHYNEFRDCLACNSNFASCISALYGDGKKSNVYIKIAADGFKNSDGSVVMHKWAVIYVSGVKYIFDPRLQGYTGRYTAKDYFGLTSSSRMGKRYRFDYWYGSWTYPITEYTVPFAN